MNTIFFVGILFLMGYIIACILWAIITTIIKKDKESNYSLTDKTEKKILIAISIFIIVIILLAEYKYFGIQNAIEYMGL